MNDVELIILDLIQHAGLKLHSIEAIQAGKRLYRKRKYELQSKPNKTKVSN